MCLVLFAYGQHSRHPLVLIANRDEFYDRPTAAAAFWSDAPAIYAGRDLVAGGTWLGVTESGRFAAVTNYRDPTAPAGELSRGALVSDFLRSCEPAGRYLEGVRRSALRYSGFNLVAGEINDTQDELWYFSNRGDGPRRLAPGIYGLSNHLLETPWPKVTRGKERFGRILNDDMVDVERCFELLTDADAAADDELPQTGVGVERERVLSPIFIRTPVYGTRSSTVVTIDDRFAIRLKERTYV